MAGREAVGLVGERIWPPGGGGGGGGGWGVTYRGEGEDEFHWTLNSDEHWIQRGGW